MCRYIHIKKSFVPMSIRLLKFVFIYVTLVGYDCYCGLECWFLSCLCGFLLCNVMLISVCVCGLQGPRQISSLGTINCIEFRLNKVY